MALALIACLTISGQVTRPLLEAYRDDAAVMNLAGRQQMLSLKLTQSAFAIDEILDHCFGAGSPPNVDCDSLEEHVDGLRKTLSLWDRSHSKLMQRDSEQGLSGDNSSEIVSLLEKIEPHYRAMHEAAERMLGILDVAGPENPKETMIRPYLRTMTAHESSFLTGMQDVVMQYEAESQARETREILIDWGLTLAILVSLVATGLMLFAPAIRVIRTQFAQLDESRSQFRRAILDAPFPIMIHAEDGEILQLNKTWTELTGYTLEDIPSIPDWTSKAYGEHKQAVRADIDNLYHLDERVS